MKNSGIFKRSALPAATPSAGANEHYETTNDNPRKCPGGQELTEAECKDAATALGYRCRRADDRWLAMPGGFFHCNSSTCVYFNKWAGGQDDPGSDYCVKNSAICKRPRPTRWPTMAWPTHSPTATAPPTATDAPTSRPTGVATDAPMAMPTTYSPTEECETAMPGATPSAAHEHYETACDNPRKCPDRQGLTEAECKEAATALGYRHVQADSW